MALITQSAECRPVTAEVMGSSPIERPNDEPLVTGNRCRTMV